MLAGTDGTRWERGEFMKRTAAVAIATAAAALLLAAPSASAEQPPPEFGRSNMGLCSSFLAQLDPPPGESNVRALINHLITQSPPGTFEVDTPGELYRVRAKQHINGPAPLECLQR
jgi:hypothetical protein